MGRALVVRLMEIKKQINAEKRRTETEQAEVKRQMAELEVQNAQLDDQARVVKAQLDRAKDYGRSHAPDVIPTCVRCFVFDGVLQNMLQVKAKISVKRYGCRRCGDEVNGDEPVISS